MRFIRFIIGCLLLASYRGNVQGECPTVAQKGKYCAVSLALGSNNHGYGFTLLSCLQATMQEKRCAEHTVKGQRFRLFNYKRNGQCSCATDKCENRFRKTDRFNNIYVATHSELEKCREAMMADSPAYGVCQPDACQSSKLFQLKIPRHMKRCAKAQCTQMECCDYIGSTTTVPVPKDPACFPPVKSKFTLAWDPPACLYTIPGAGNTMTRLLIDAVLAGYHSGSVYHDPSLFNKLPGESSCHRSASVIKIHPSSRTSFSVVFNQHKNLVGCKRCIPDAFVAAVVVLRDPLRSFFANYNLKRSNGRFTNRHTNRIKKIHFNRSDFNHKAIADAVGTRIRYRRDFLLGIKAHLPASHYVFVSFEKLTSSNVQVRRAALRTIVEFLTVNGTIISDEELDHAFASAQSEHRPPPQADDLTFDDAFTPDLIRRYWETLGSSASAFGYGPNVSTRASSWSSAPRAPAVEAAPKPHPKPHPIQRAHVRPEASPHVVARPSQSAGEGILQQLVARGRSVAPFPIIIVFASSDSVQELLNFAQSVRLSRGDRGLAELTVLATGTRPIGLPAEVGVISLHQLREQLSISVAPPWILRLQILKSLLDEGLDVMLNDLDAIWLRDPHSEIFAHLPSAHIIAHRSSYPGIMGRTSKKIGFWGATVCTGFAYFRSTKATRTFFGETLSSTVGMNDDQRWLNYNLYKYKISWPETRRQAKIDVHSGPTTIGNVSSIGLGVALVDTEQVVRFCLGKRSARAVVEHCHFLGLTQLKTGSRMERLMKRDTWFLSKVVIDPFAFIDKKNVTRASAWKIILDGAVSVPDT